MGASFSLPFGTKDNRDSFLMVGLDGVGKTKTIHYLQYGETFITIPTFSEFSCRQVTEA